MFASNQQRKQRQVFNISFCLSPSHEWACSIYLFRQYIISFWRSHLPYSQLYCKQQVKNASEMRRDVAQYTAVLIKFVHQLAGPTRETSGWGRHLEIRPVILSAAKDRCVRGTRSFAALRMTGRRARTSAHGRSSLQMSVDGAGVFLEEFA